MNDLDGMLRKRAAEQYLILKKLLDDPRKLGKEDIHRLRVTLRRIRTIFLFAESTVDDRARKLRKGCRRQARLLGSVRDLDVLVDRIGQDESAPLKRRDAKEWLEILRAERFALWSLTREALTSKSFGHWRHLVRDWTEEPSVAGPGAWTAVSETARRLAQMSSDSFKEKHRFRIQAKRLRYLLEFLPERPEWVQAAIPQLIALQDAIGATRDLENAAREAVRRQNVFRLAEYASELRRRANEADLDTQIDSVKSAAVRWIASADAEAKQVI